MKILLNCCSIGRTKVHYASSYCTVRIISHLSIVEVKETADLATVEVRKGFSHMHQNLDVTSEHCSAHVL